MSSSVNIGYSIRKVQGGFGVWRKLENQPEQIITRADGQAGLRTTQDEAYHCVQLQMREDHIAGGRLGVMIAHTLTGMPKDAG